MGKSQQLRQILSLVNWFWEVPSAWYESKVLHHDTPKYCFLEYAVLHKQHTIVPLWLREWPVPSLVAKWPSSCRDSAHLLCVFPWGGFMWLVMAWPAGSSGFPVLAGLSHRLLSSWCASLFPSHVGYPRFLGNCLSFLLIT